MTKNALLIEYIHSDLYESTQDDPSSAALESYVSVLKHCNEYYITDTTHDDCDLDIQRNRIVIISLRQLDAIQRAIDVVREDILMSTMQEDSQKRGEYE